MIATHVSDLHGSGRAPFSNGYDWTLSSGPSHGSFQESDTPCGLEDFPLSERFRSWRGASGERYIFSVYDSRGCPAYKDAILIAVEVDASGARKPLAFVDTGSFPEPLITKLTRAYGPRDNIEFHVHLLANDTATRRKVLVDLGGNG